MSLAGDHRGLESLPLKLMVVAVIASLSIIPAAEALQGLRERDFERRADLELAHIIACVELLTVDGPGNVRTLHLDFTCEGSPLFSRLVLGDDREGPNSSSIVLLLRGGGLMIRTASEPPAWMCSASGTGLTVDSPVFELRLSSVQTNQTRLVVVEVH